MKASDKIERRIRRHKRIRARVRGDAARPRLNVFRSNKHVFLQLVDDEKNKTILGLSDKSASSVKGNKTEKAYLTGKKIAELANKKGIKEAIFDKGGYVYHGRIKAAADGAREGGLKF